MSTLAEKQLRLAEYRLAESKVLKGQEVEVGQGNTRRRVRRADLINLQTMIRELEDDIAAEQARTTGARRAYRIVPGAR